MGRAVASIETDSFQVSGARAVWCRHRVRAASILFLCALLGACSAIYNYRVAAWWVRWYVEDYVRWSDAQEPLFRARVQEQLRWHQSTQLPRYREWLERMQTQISAPLDVEQVRAQMDQLRGFGNDIMQRLEPDIDRFLADLSDRQARDLIRRFREEHAETVDEYADLSPEKTIRERTRSMRKGIERITGNLDAGQRERIEQWAALMPDNRAQWLASRERWIDAFEQALARRSEPEYFAARIHELFVDPEHSWDPEYRQRLERNTELTLQLLADIHNSLTPRQRAAADKNVKKWLGVIDELAVERY